MRTWCPELARLPNDYIHTPWLAPPHVLRDAGVELGVTYPRPLLIVPQWNQQVNLSFNSSIDHQVHFFSLKIVENPHRISNKQHNVGWIFISRTIVNDPNPLFTFELDIVLFFFFFILLFQCFKHSL